MRKYDFIVSAVMTTLSVSIFCATAAYSNTGGSAQQNSALWPRIIATALILCSIALFLQALLKKKNPNEDDSTPAIDWKSEGMKKVYIALGCVVVFLILNKIVGMLLALLFLLPAVLWIMGCKSKSAYIAIPVGMVGFIYVFFYLLMSVGFPKPFWA